MILYLIDEKCNPDDKQFITDLYLTYKPAMVATAKVYVSCPHDIEDILQGTILKLIPKTDLLKTMNTFSIGAYISYTIKSVAISHLRHQNVVDRHIVAADKCTQIENIPDPNILPEVWMINKEWFTSFYKQFQMLSEEDQLLLRGKYILELTDDELAHLLHCKASSIRMKLTRARRRAQLIFERRG